MRRRFACVVLMALLCAVVVSGTALAQVDWKQLQGTEIRFLMNKHPFTTFIEPKVAEFEKLTGIKVVMEVFPEDQYRNKRTIELNAGGKLDGYMIMPGQDDLYYWKAGWLQPLDDYIKDPKLTDAAWDPKDFFASFTKAVNGGRQADRRRHQLPRPRCWPIARTCSTSSRSRCPTTMKELEETAKFFHGKEVDGKKMVGITLRGKGAAATSQWVDFLYSFGGSWTNAQGKSNFASPQDIAAFKFYGDLLRNYGPEGGTMLHWAESTSSLHGGQGRHDLRRQRVQVSL